VLIEFTASGLSHTFTEGVLPKGDNELDKEDSLQTTSKGIVKELLYALYQVHSSAFNSYTL
jgi:hypothetical protein